MKKYVGQLAEDLQKAAEKIADIFREINQKYPSEGISDENLRKKNKQLVGPMKMVSGITGINMAMFPADHLLNDAQTELLALKMESVFAALNCTLCFPKDFGKKVPPRLRYRAMRETWDMETVKISTHKLRTEFCYFDEKNCPFPGYCKRCAEFEKEHPGEIKGIFNFCDKWCAHCAFTSRCLIFLRDNIASELPNTFEQSSEGQPLEIEERLSFPYSKNYHDNIYSLYHFNPHNSDEVDYLTECENIKKEYPIISKAQTYSEESDEWLNTIISTSRTEFPGWEAAGHAEQILSAIETVFWYHLFIYCEISNALAISLQPGNDAFEEDCMNGSAKVCLIAIDRSIEAFAFLKGHVYPSHLIEMIEFVEQLNDMRYEIEALFPDARAFIRPGLDE